MLLPPSYLVLRTLGAGGEAWSLVARPRTVQLLAQTAGLAAAVTAASALIAVPLAWLTTRTDLPLRRFWTVLTVLPLTIPSYVGGFTIVAAIGPRGLLQQALAAPLGIDRLPDIYGFPGAWLTLTLLTYPYLLLTMRAGLRGLDPACEESARSLGFGTWKTFWRLTLPQLRPSLAVGGLLVGLYVLGDFGAVSMLQFDSFTHAIYIQYQGAFDRTLAASFALILVAMTGLLLVAEVRLRGSMRYHRSTGVAPRPASMLRLGRWRWPAVVYAAVVVLLALALPVGVLGYWLVRGLARGEVIPELQTAALNSVYVSALAAVAATLVALPVAALAVRYRGRIGSFVERAAYLGYALPGIVIALALVFFGARYAPMLYQTLPLLIIAYLVRFLPQAVGTARGSLLQVPPLAEDAARNLGAAPPRVLVGITIPLMAPGLVAGAALVFLTTMKELPATLLLSPIGFGTLATKTWSAASEAYFAQAAAPALLLVAVSALSLLIILRGPRSRVTGP
ncbi:MAG: iron ABC transporter permease [Dehalococcoidia bacterium]|nr:iron ABC transporter permease [Dehalococcoidia bacterium]